MTTTTSEIPKGLLVTPPPRPYLDMESVAVLRRSVASEILRVAFKDLGPLTPRPDYSNTHGNFGGH